MNIDKVRFECVRNTNLLCKSACRCSVFFRCACLLYIDTRIARMFFLLVRFMTITVRRNKNQKESIFICISAAMQPNSSTKNIAMPRTKWPRRFSEMCHQFEHMLSAVDVVLLTQCTQNHKFRCCLPYIMWLIVCILCSQPIFILMLQLRLLFFGAKDACILFWKLHIFLMLTEQVLRTKKKMLCCQLFFRTLLLYCLNFFIRIFYKTFFLIMKRHELF